MVMATYRVRAGHVLPHHSQDLPAGSLVELPEHVATDSAVSAHVERVDDVAASAVTEPVGRRRRGPIEESSTDRGTPSAIPIEE